MSSGCNTVEYGFVTRCGHQAVVGPMLEINHSDEESWRCQLKLKGNRNTVNFRSGSSEQAAKTAIAKFLRIPMTHVQTTFRVAQTTADPFENGTSLENYLETMRRTLETRIGHDLAFRIVDDMYDYITLDALERIRLNLVNVRSPAGAMTAIVADLRRYWAHPVVCQHGLEGIIAVDHNGVGFRDVMGNSLGELLLSVLETHFRSTRIIVPLCSVLTSVFRFVPTGRAYLLCEKCDRCGSALVRTLEHYSTEKTILAEVLTCFAFVSGKPGETRFAKAIFRAGVVSLLWEVLKNHRDTVPLTCPTVRILTHMHRSYIYALLLPTDANTESRALICPPPNWEEILMSTSYVNTDYLRVIIRWMQ